MKEVRFTGEQALRGASLQHAPLLQQLLNRDIEEKEKQGMFQRKKATN